jgi:hypothetical protein
MLRKTVKLNILQLKSFQQKCRNKKPSDEYSPRLNPKLRWRSVIKDSKIRIIYSCMYVCIRGGLLQPLHLDPQWSIVLNHYDEDDFWRIGGMKTGRGNRSTRRKPTPAPLCPPQNPT